MPTVTSKSKPKVLFHVVSMLGMLLAVFLCDAVYTPSLLHPMERFPFSRLALAFNFLSVLLIYFCVVAITGRWIFSYVAAMTTYFLLIFLNALKIRFLREPLVWTDIYTLRSAVLISRSYLNLGQLLSLAAGVLVATLLIFWGEKKFRIARPPMLFRAGSVLVAVTFFSSFYWAETSFWFPLNASRKLYRQYHNARLDISQKGLIYSNLLAIKSSIAVAPPTFSRAKVLDILKNYREEGISDEAEAPERIIVYVIESFFDPTTMRVSFKKDPMPFLRALSAKYSSGVVKVPTVGGGTCNTEFELLTGFPIANLPSSESHPFVQYITRPMDALPTVMADHGYRTVAFHNNSPYFWNRRKVYPDLGFKQFFSSVDMFQPNRIPGTSDQILVDKILTEANRHEGKQFLYAVTLASHGPYFPPPYLRREFVATAAPTVNALDQVDVYSHRLAAADEAVKQLITGLEKSKQRTMVLILGDHLPNFEGALDLFQSDSHETPFIKWTNYPQKKEAMSISAFNLPGLILSWTGMTVPPAFSVMKKLAMTSAGTDAQKLLRHLKFIQYDQLFGENLSSTVNQLRAPERIAHAGGALNGKIYTNSLEALEKSKRSYHTIELDFDWTKDGKLVLLHDWQQTMKNNFNASAGQRTFSEFKALRSPSSFTQLSAEDLVEWLKKNPSVQVVTDVKDQNLKALIWLKAHLPNYKRQLIAQIYEPKEYDEAKRLGYERVIFTTYRYTISDEDLVQFAKEKQPYAITVYYEHLLKSNVAAELRRVNTPTLAFTVDDSAVEAALKKRGVSGVYTDGIPR